MSKSDDTISRQDAIDIVRRYDKSHMILKGKPMIGATSIVIELEDLPSAQPEKCKGEWVECLAELPSASRPKWEWKMLERDENVFDIYGVPTWGINYMCDKCKFITTAIQDHFSQYKFCPSCGADMRGENHENR